MWRKLKAEIDKKKRKRKPRGLQLSQFIFSYFVNLLRADAMKPIITDTVKESKGRGRHPSSNMVLLLLSRFRINWIMLSASTWLQFLILWFRLDQSISKFWRKAGQLKRSDQKFQYHFCKQNRAKIRKIYFREDHIGDDNKQPFRNEITLHTCIFLPQPYAILLLVPYHRHTHWTIFLDLFYTVLSVNGFAHLFWCSKNRLQMALQHRGVFQSDSIGHLHRRTTTSLDLKLFHNETQM